MYNAKYVENEIIIDSLKTESIKELAKFFDKNKIFASLNNRMEMVASIGKTESFKFYKRKNDRSKYIEVMVE